MVIWSPQCSRSWVRYQSTARRSERRSAVAQRQGGGAFAGVAHPPDLREVLRPGQIGAQLGEHPAARFDRGQLVGVADQDGFGAGGRGGGQQFAQIAGADHGGLIDDHQGVRSER